MIGRQPWLCPECGAEVVLVIDASGTDTPTYVCAEDWAHDVTQDEDWEGA